MVGEESTSFPVRNSHFFVPSGFKVYEQKNAINSDAFLGTYYVDQDKFDELIRFRVILDLSKDD